MDDVVKVPAVVTDSTGQEIRLYVEAHRMGGEEEIGFSFAEGLDSAMETIRVVSTRVADAVRAVSPDTFSVELGFEFVVEAGRLVALFAKAGGTASINVTLEWEKDAANTGVAQTTRN